MASEENTIALQIVDHILNDGKTDREEIIQLGQTTLAMLQDYHY